MNFEKYALEKFGNGQNLGMSQASQDGIWQNTAYSDTEEYDEVHGIDVIGELSEDLLFTVETEEAEAVDTEIPGREYLDPKVEYKVGVEVFTRDGETVDEGTATILSGKADQTSVHVWSDHAVTAALSEEEIEYVESGVENTGGGDLNFLLDKESEPTGIDAIDSVQ